jgi:hypothetical protein
MRKWSRSIPTPTTAANATQPSPVSRSRPAASPATSPTAIERTKWLLE